MAKPAGLKAPSSVFINCPFDARYEPLFVALVAGLVGLGRSPHCVLEVAEKGQGRLTRIFELMASCDASIHDLSRIGLSGGVPRFNMPFELGLAWSLSRQAKGHAFYVFEAREHRLQKSLSDLNGHDPEIHGDKQHGVLNAVLNRFGSFERAPAPKTLRSINRQLQASARCLKKDRRVKSIFSSATFKALVTQAAFIAENEGAIAAE